DQLAARVTALGVGVTADVRKKGAAFRLVATLAEPVLPFRLIAVEGGTETNVVAEPLDLSADRFELPVNSEPTADPKRQPPPPRPPRPPPAPDHPTREPFPPEAARSLALPVRSAQFGQGLLALQWQALPFFYRHRLLLVAQSAAVVSPITAVEQRDFEYRSP